MKAGLFLLALTAVSASDIAKSGKSSSTRSGSKSGKAEVFEEINALAKSGKSSTRSGSKSGKAALLKKNIAVGAAIATIDEAFNFEEYDDEDDRNFWDLDLEMEDLERSKRGYRKNPNNKNSISRQNGENCVRRCDNRRRGGSRNARGDYCVPDCTRAVCAARRGRSGRDARDCLRSLSSSSRNGRRNRRSFSSYDSCDGNNIRRSNNGKQRCKLNASGKRKVQRAQRRNRSNRNRSRGRSRRGVDDDKVGRRRGRDDDFTFTTYASEDEEDEDQDFAKDGLATTVAPPTTTDTKAAKKAAKDARSAAKKEAKEARKAEREAAGSSSKSAKNPTTTAATEASFAEVA